MIRGKIQNWETIKKFFIALFSFSLLVVACFLAISNWKLLKKVTESVKSRQLAEANLTALVSRESDLTKKVSELETEEGLEKEIRERFPFAKPGEEVIMVVDSNSNVTNENETTVKKSLWKKFVEWVKE